MSETIAASTAAGFPRASRQRGFTLIEVTVSLIVTVIVLLGVLALFDFSNKLTRVQTNISDMQQSLRSLVGQVRESSESPRLSPIMK